MADHGAPIAYITLAEGTPVYASGGEQVGTVRRVLADAEADIFDGIVLDTDEGERFADAPAVGDLFEHAAFLELTAAQARHLHAPDANPAVMDAHVDDAEEPELRARLRRAWDVLSGRY
ncbi:MAG: hypothetical protein M3459_04405 [Actinomycetota bacterium]|nr:hypothetical protein [Actinomycetota bacterium]